MLWYFLHNLFEHLIGPNGKIINSMTGIKHVPSFGSFFMNRQGSLAQFWKPKFSTRISF